MKNFFIRHLYKVEVLFIFILGLIPLLWYKKDHMALGHDMGFPLAPFDYFQDRLFTWSDRVAPFGANQTDSINGFFIHGLEGLFSFLGFSLLHTQQLTFIFWFVLPGITMYIFLRSLYPQKEDFIIRLTGSSFYMMNHYLLQAWIIAERTKFSTYAALPLITLFIINVLYRKKSILQNAILLSITLFFLNGGAGIPLYGGLALVVFGSTIGIFILREEHHSFMIKRAIKFFVLAGIFLTILNAYWVLPYVSSFAQNYTERVAATGGGNGAAEWSREISKHASYINLLRLQGIPDWYGEDHPYASNFLHNPFLILLSVLFPILVFIGILPKKGESKQRRLYTYLFLIILMVAIPFSAGSHTPFGWLYDLALQYVPGFSIFRTPIYKFGMALWFAYACLVALGVKVAIDFLKEHYKRSIGFIPVYILGFFAVIAVIFIYNYPLFIGNFFDWSKKYSTMVNVPEYIFDAKRYIDRNEFSTRKLSIPPLNSNTSYVIHDWKYFSLSPIPEMLSRNPVIINGATLNQSEKRMVTIIYDQLRQSSSSSMLGYLGVDEMLVMNDMATPQDMRYSVEPLIRSVKQKYSTDSNLIYEKWEFLPIENAAVTPLISRPDKFFYVNVNGESETLEAVTDIIPSTGKEVFIFDGDELGSDDLRAVLPYAQYIVQGVCENCEESKFIVPTTASRILPGTRFYPFAEYLYKSKKQKIQDPSQKIDFILGNIAKEAAAIELMIHNDKKKHVINEIMIQWRDSFSEIETLYRQINDEKKKDDNARKIHTYVTYFAYISKMWESNAQREDKKIFQSFILFSKQYIKKLNISSEDSLPPTAPRQYMLSIPKDGEYQLHIPYNQINLALFDIPKVKIANKEVLLSLDERYMPTVFFSSEPIPLKKGQQLISLSGVTRRYVTSKTVESLPVIVDPGEEQCSSIEIDDPEAILSHRILFNVNADIKDILSATVYESNNQFTRQRATEQILTFGDDDGGTFQAALEYVPSEFVKRAEIQICIDSYNAETIRTTINNIKFMSLFPHPQVYASTASSPSSNFSQNELDFVALNQTKYLIRLPKSMDETVINFNSRFDTGWKMREVDKKLAEKYFSGKMKKYENGVREFESKDEHILTDFIFPVTNSPASVIQKESNSFANLFIIKDKGKNSERVFLLEYDMQNKLYKTSIISLIALVVLISIYFISKRYENHKKII